MKEPPEASDVGMLLPTAPLRFTVSEVIVAVEFTRISWFATHPETCGSKMVSVARVDTGVSTSQTLLFVPLIATVDALIGEEYWMTLPSPKVVFSWMKSATTAAVQL